MYLLDLFFVLVLLHSKDTLSILKKSECEYHVLVKISRFFINNILVQYNGYTHTEKKNRIGNN